MTKRIEPGFHSVSPDKDQEQVFQTKKKDPIDEVQKDPVSKKTIKTETHKTKASPAALLSSILIYGLLGGGGYWFYLQDMKSEKLIASSEQRIVELEKQLSATGEEIGESTVALKVKLENLTKKYNELWKENDKLWASAWRRNQSEIKALDKQVKASLTSITTNKNNLSNIDSKLVSINEKQTGAEFTVDALTEKLKSVNTLSAKLTSFSKELSSIQSKTLSRDKQQLEIASSVTALDSLHHELSTQVDKLEMALADLKASQPMSSGNTATPPSPIEQ